MRKSELRVCHETPWGTTQRNSAVTSVSCAGVTRRLCLSSVGCLHDGAAKVADVLRLALRLVLRLGHDGAAKVADVLRLALGLGHDGLGGAGHFCCLGVVKRKCFARG